MNKLSTFRILAAALLFSCTSAGAVEEIDELLARPDMPPGIVFEIVSADDDALGELLPGLRAGIKRLRDRFPDLPVAIVSHGQEQFSLVRSTQASEPDLHGIAESIVESDDVALHVCGTHAGWYGGSPEDYPDYVDVSPSGPAQINDYRALGYELVTLP